MPDLKFLAQTVPEIRRGPKIPKVGHVTPSRSVSRRSVDGGDLIFGILDPDMPVHYTTFMGLR